MPSSRRGILIVVCAPSGAGKSTLVSRLMGEFDNLRFSVSCTTRPPRPGEVEGRDYLFISREEFETRKGRGEFAEWAEVYGNLYGTPRKEVLDLLAAGRDVLFDIDVQGARQLKASLGKGCHVFILPPSLSELERRLRGRGTDRDEAVSRRLASAPTEIAEAPSFDYLILNRDVDAAYMELRSIYVAQGLKPEVRPGIVEEILRS
jgi:guanylate kinase